MNTLIAFSLITFGFIIIIVIMACFVPPKKLTGAKEFIIAVMPKLPLTAMIEAWKNKNDDDIKPRS